MSHEIQQLFYSKLGRGGGGVGVVLYHEGEETMALSFKLEFTREKRPWRSHSSWSFLVQKILQNTRPILLG